MEVLGSSKTRDIFDAIVDDVKAVLAADVKVVRAAGAQAKVPVTPTTTAEEWYAAVNAAEGVDEATKASLAVLKERKPLYFDLAFKVRGHAWAHTHGYRRGGRSRRGQGGVRGGGVRSVRRTTKRRRRSRSGRPWSASGAARAGACPPPSAVRRRRRTYVDTGWWWCSAGALSLR